jgi:hypothetical protein
VGVGGLCPPFSICLILPCYRWTKNLIYIYTYLLPLMTSFNGASNYVLLRHAQFLRIVVFIVVVTKYSHRSSLVAWVTDGSVFTRISALFMPHFGVFDGFRSVSVLNFLVIHMCFVLFWSSVSELFVLRSVAVFWIVTPCGLAGSYQTFGGTHHCHLCRDVEAVRSS